MLLPRMSWAAARQPVSVTGSVFGEICSDDGSPQPHSSQLIPLCRAAFLLISVPLISPPNCPSLPISSPVPAAV